MSGDLMEKVHTFDLQIPFAQRGESREREHACTSLLHTSCGRTGKANKQTLRVQSLWANMCGVETLTSLSGTLREWIWAKKSLNAFLKWRLTL